LIAADLRTRRWLGGEPAKHENPDFETEAGLFAEPIGRRDQVRSAIT